MFGYTINNTLLTDIINSILKIGALVLCVIILLTNHNDILSEYEKCKKNGNYDINYPNESLNIFITLKNMVSEYMNYLGICDYSPE
jgi:hypothetical protein